jgi:hypothetical protein
MPPVHPACISWGSCAARLQSRSAHIDRLKFQDSVRLGGSPTLQLSTHARVRGVWASNILGSPRPDVRDRSLATELCCTAALT